MPKRLTSLAFMPYIHANKWRGLRLGRFFIGSPLGLQQDWGMMMFAVVKTGGKQYKVAEGDVVQVEKLAGDKGAKIQLQEVLMVHNNGSSKFGTPTLAGASVEAEIIDQKRSGKVIVFKKKRRANYRRFKGHRQEFTALKITAIKA
jgi:large subunit ribosomal protein L21